MRHDYNIETQVNLYKAISEVFTIKQFTIQNPTSFPIYVNLSYSLPSATKSDYLVQAKSNFVSPEVSTNTISIYHPNSTPSIGIAKITVSDSADLQEANIIPYTTPQYVPIPNYPVNIEGSGSVIGKWSSNYRALLPDIYLENYQNIIFLVESHTIYNGGVQVPTEIRIASTVHSYLYDGSLGAISGFGGSCSFSPNYLPNTFKVNLYKPTPSTLQKITVNAFYSNEANIQADYTGNLLGPILPPSSTQSVYSAINSPGCMLSVTLGSGPAYDVNGTIDIYFAKCSDGGIGQSLLKRITFARTLPGPDMYFEVYPEPLLMSIPGFLIFVVTNNHATNTLTLNIGSTSL